MNSEAIYLALYALAAAVDERLRRGHLRDCRGRLIQRFDQWLLAAEKGEWDYGATAELYPYSDVLD